MESPLYNYNVPDNLFTIKDDSLIAAFKGLHTNHRVLELQNKLNDVNRDFNIAMFYFYRGIPDDEWKRSPGKDGLSVEFFPNFKEEHFSNQYNFNYFVQIFFYKVTTLYEIIGHLIYDRFSLPINEKNQRDKISFNSAISKLKSQERNLHQSLQMIKNSSNFRDGTKMRNDIAHNQPAYEISSSVTIKDGLTAFGTGSYTKSKEIKRTMINYLQSVKETFMSLEQYLLKS
ncbi:Cthe_2314 family HEPN domain-containing protein [Planococcus maritimus]|uniref:Cthe_2314 family HEPN domain-containing protein n=1 Tax=Planococcus maritimus TaxID=192421 RepID=UPI0031393F16